MILLSLAVFVSPSAFAQQFTGYPKAVLQGAHDANEKTHVVFTLHPDMVARVSAGQKQLHLQLTYDAYERLQEMVVENFGSTLTIQTADGLEVVTTVVSRPLRNELVLSKEYDKRTDLQKAYKSLTLRK